jgi:hypothetical protein
MLFPTQVWNVPAGFSLREYLGLQMATVIGLRNANLAVCLCLCYVCIVHAVFIVHAVCMFM